MARDRCIRSLVVALAGALLASLVVAVPLAPEAAAQTAAPVECEADGDSRPTGTVKTYRTTGELSDPNLKMLRSIGWYDDYLDRNAGPWDVRVCDEDGFVTLMPVFNGDTETQVIEAKLRYEALNAAAEKLSDFGFPGTEMTPAPNHVQIVGLDTLLAADLKTFEQEIKTETFSEFGVAVRVTVRPIQSIWTFDDGTPKITCQDRGTLFDEIDETPVKDQCRKQWDRVGDGKVDATVSVRYALKWESSINGSDLNAGVIAEVGRSTTVELIVGEFNEVLTGDETADQLEPPKQLGEAEQYTFRKADRCGGLFSLLCTVVNAAVGLAADLINTLAGDLLVLGRQIWQLITGCGNFFKELFSSFLDMLAQIALLFTSPSKFIGQKVESAGQMIGGLVEMARVFASGDTDAIKELLLEILGDLLESELEAAGGTYSQLAGKFLCEGILSVVTAGAAAAAGSLARIAIKKFPVIMRILKKLNGRDNDRAESDPDPLDRDKDRGDDDEDRNKDDDDKDDGGLTCSKTIPVSSSFPTGTLVRLANGELKAIQDIEPGDLVLAGDPHTGQWTAREVTHQWSYLDTDEMATIVISDGTHISATDHHRFWVDNKGRWVEAENLQPGDYLLTPNGVTAVDQVDVRDSQSTLVWELTIGVVHTFTVHTGSHDLLVHNQQKKPKGKKCASEERIAELDEVDPATGRKDAKTRQEAQVGADLEARGDLKNPIVRDPSGSAEFIDGDGQAWDIKGYVSEYENGFDRDTAVSSIRDEIAIGENVIVDTTRMSPEHIEQLSEALAAEIDLGKVVWYEP